MANHLSQDEVKGIAEYARIGLTDDELVWMTRDLNGTLDSLDAIFAYDLEGVEPTFHPIGSLSNVMRKDVEQPSFSQAVALENAPASQDGCFLIPSILGYEESEDEAEPETEESETEEPETEEFETEAEESEVEESEAEVEATSEASEAEAASEGDEA